MSRTRRPSRQTALVLARLASRGGEWRHGYDLCLDTGLASGTVYPLLVRLHDNGFLDARWEPSPQPGRPARHVYRLTASGLRLAREAAAAEPASPPAVVSGAPA